MRVSSGACLSAGYVALWSTAELAMAFVVPSGPAKLCLHKSSGLSTSSMTCSLRHRGGRRRSISATSMSAVPDIESPFASPGIADDDSDELLPLTLENVELVLDEMRPYLMSDGGNVRVAEIDGPVVKLELQGACGSCPSSTMTMKMGLERRLVEKIPEISQVIQAMPDGPNLNEAEIEKVLDGVRPFLSVAGGEISIDSLTGVGGLQPRVALKMTGSSSSLMSVKMEIMQRIQKNFMVGGLRVEFV